jgi:hypothetical protein
MDSNAVVMGEFTTLLSPNIGHPNKKIIQLNDTLDQMDLTEVYRIFHPTTAQYTLFSATHGTFSKVDHILGHKASLSTFNKILITPCILSDHNAIKLELNNKSNSRKYTNNWRVNNILLNDQWAIEEIREEIKRFLEVNENENTTYQKMQQTQS